jgi:hypothetical protein
LKALLCESGQVLEVFSHDQIRRYTEVCVTIEFILRNKVVTGFHIIGFVPKVDFYATVVGNRQGYGIDG